MAGVGRAGVYIGVVAEGAGMRSLQPYFMSGEWAWVGKRVGAEGGKLAQMLGENRPIQRRPLCLLGGRNSWGHSRGEKTYAFVHPWQACEACVGQLWALHREGIKEQKSCCQSAAATSLKNGREHVFHAQLQGHADIQVPIL